jgi:hypothetical protein
MINVSCKAGKRDRTRPELRSFDLSTTDDEEAGASDLQQLTRLMREFGIDTGDSPTFASCLRRLKVALQQRLNPAAEMEPQGEPPPEAEPDGGDFSMSAAEFAANFKALRRASADAADISAKFRQGDGKLPDALLVARAARDGQSVSIR